MKLVMLCLALLLSAGVARGEDRIIVIYVTNNNSTRLVCSGNGQDLKQIQILNYKEAPIIGFVETETKACPLKEVRRGEGF